MAENYKIGVRRIFYRSKQFKENKNVTMDILSPSLNWKTDIEFAEVGKGGYFLDFNFSEIGTYFALLYENGEKVTSQNFQVSNETLYVITTKYKGPSVTNNG